MHVSRRRPDEPPVLAPSDADRWTAGVVSTSPRVAAASLDGPAVTFAPAATSVPGGASAALRPVQPTEPSEPSKPSEPSEPGRVPAAPAAVLGLAGLGTVLILLYDTGAFRPGLIGVELLLLVSGFLVTQAVLPVGLAGRGLVGVLRLERQRLKYLAVVLTVTLALTAALIYLVAGLDEARRSSAQTVPAVLQVANWRPLWDGNVAWDRLAWDGSGRFEPLGHLWLASLLEQSVLAWSLALVLLCWIARRSLTAVTVLVWAAFAAAAAFAPLAYDGTNGARIYLGTDSHAVAFVAGAAAQCTLRLLQERSSAGKRRRRRESRGLPAGSVTALAAGALTLLAGAGLVAASRPEAWLRAGGLGLTGLAAAVLALTLCQQQGHLARLFSWGPLTELGRLAYPMYLLHLPIYWLLATTKPEMASYGLLLLGGGLVWLAALIVHYAIGERLRVPTWRARLALPITAACGAVVLVSVLLPAAVEKRMNPGGGPVALTLGDSLAGDLAAALAGHGSGRLGVVDGAGPDCGVMPAELVRTSSGQVHAVARRCADWASSWRTSIARAHPSVILVHLGADAQQRWLDGRWLSPCDLSYRQRYTRQLEAAARVWAEEAPRARVLLLNERSATAAADEAATRCYNAIVRRVAVAEPQVALLDLDGFLCPDRRCGSATPDGRPLYSGRVHLSRPGMGYVAGWLERSIGRV
jgi:peptidoglycan/LPS O-acetylase OafA/YrhL